MLNGTDMTQSVALKKKQGNAKCLHEKIIKGYSVYHIAWNSWWLTTAKAIVYYINHTDQCYGNRIGCCSDTTIDNT